MTGVGYRVWSKEFLLSWHCSFFDETIAGNYVFGIEGRRVRFSSKANRFYERAVPLRGGVCEGLSCVDSVVQCLHFGLVYSVSNYACWANRSRPRDQ